MIIAIGGTRGYIDIIKTGLWSRPDEHLQGHFCLISPSMRHVSTRLWRTVSFSFGKNEINGGGSTCFETPAEPGL